jgi:hypothetical protein
MNYALLKIDPTICFQTTSTLQIVGVYEGWIKYKGSKLPKMGEGGQVYKFHTLAEFKRYLNSVGERFPGL